MLFYSLAPSQGVQAQDAMLAPPMGSADSTRSGKDTSAMDIDDVKNIHREFNHKEQVITASAFMGVMVFLLAGMNNFNPRRQQ